MNKPKLRKVAREEVAYVRHRLEVLAHRLDKLERLLLSLEDEDVEED